MAAVATVNARPAVSSAEEAASFTAENATSQAPVDNDCAGQMAWFVLLFLVVLAMSVLALRSIYSRLDSPKTPPTADPPASWVMDNSATPAAV